MQDLINQSINLASSWQTRANELIDKQNQRFNSRINNMLSSKDDKYTLIKLLDRSFRSKDNKRVSRQIDELFAQYKIPNFFSLTEKGLMFLFLYVGKYVPNVSVPLMIKKIRDETKDVVIKGEDDILSAYLQKRATQNLTININLIGEVVLGENEANDRMQKYLQALKNPAIEYISIKISTIFSQINPLSFDETVDELVQRLKVIYSCAKEHKTKNGEAKFINLDMEEYRDLAITYYAFTKALDLPEFKDLKAGIVLQAYLPDSHLWQQKLVAWAKNRVENGGSPIKMRIVKGANMEMEETESSLKGWELAPYSQKIDTDANYKRMVRFGLDPDNIKYVNIGSASHNLFELAHAYSLAKQNGVLEHYSIEMLEGMSLAATMAIKELSKDVILYSPVAKLEQFTNAIAYLVRRLDENTSDENFIRYSFGLKVGSKAWIEQEKRFKDSFAHEPFLGSHRTQNRLTENFENYKNGSFYTKKFTNEPDTDFVLEANRKWAEKIKQDYSNAQITAPIVIGGDEILERDTRDVLDKSLGKNFAKVCIPTAQDLQTAVEVAKKDPDGWRNLSQAKRHEILSNVANEFRKNRNKLIGIAAAEVGKVFTETDPEVSEAIDFLEFYPHAMDSFSDDGLDIKPLGVGLVASPWNFPIAIPTGGISASLASGNTVILKPASSAALCAYELCKCFWQAGVSKNTLQFVPASGKLANDYFISNKDIDFVILTGGEETAYNMLKTRPELFVSAETGGKDATIVTQMADRELAIKNIVHSAFSNSGQKCSATSLLVLLDEVYNDKIFKETLVDTASSLHVGSVWDFKNKLGCLSDKPNGALKKAIETLEDGESWALEPSFANSNEYMLKPSIKWGVKRGSFCHMTELFGAVLSVVRAKDLDDAIDIVNSTGYGLTSGIESLDDKEVEYFKAKIQAGNIYINKPTTGAIVLRQPFGGFGKSAVGAGRKAGFFNYPILFTKLTETTPPSVSQTNHELLSLVNSWQEATKTGIYKDLQADLSKLAAALPSYLNAFENEFSQEKEHYKVRGESNVVRYIALKNVSLRVTQNDTLFEILARIFAAKISGVFMSVSVDANAKSDAISFLFEHKDKLNAQITRQTEEEFAANLAKNERIFYAQIDYVSDYVFAQAAKTATFIVRQSPLMRGRLELANYFKEQSISNCYHRYGNLGGSEA